MLCFLPSCKLSRSQVLCIVGYFTCSTNNMISRNCYRHFEISKCECKLTTSCELVMLPSFEIAVHTKTRIPLRHCENMIAIFREKLITTTATYGHTISDLVIPSANKNKFLSWL